MKSQSAYVIGLDYGTDSVRALLVNAESGEELASSVHTYSRWKKGLFCDAGKSQFRQHPLDYVEGLQSTITAVVNQLPKNEYLKIKAISIATTGSTPVAVNKEGTPLALLPQFELNPNAMFVLWKDHSAIQEANQINELAKKWPIDFTKYSGGTYSSEWFWSKLLHIIKNDDDIRNHVFTWIEHCDWMPALLTGNNNALTIKRSRCAAGHKAMWNEEFGGLPSNEFLVELDPFLGKIADNFYTETYTSDQVAGTISKDWAKKLGLPDDVLIGVGALDAHFGAVGANIQSNSLVKVLGTSTCDMLITPIDNNKQKIVKGICGQVNGSIVPNMIGMEAGQSAFGDYYLWFQQILCFPLFTASTGIISQDQIHQIKENILKELSHQASELPITKNDEIALDWINGRRTPYANQQLKAAIINLDLASSAASLFKAIVESTAFGAKAIIKKFEEDNIIIDKVIAVGGIAEKSAYVIQTLANVLNMPISVPKDHQVCALGGAMFASVISGIHPDLTSAQKTLASGFDKTYYPDKFKADIYKHLYKKYQKLGDYVDNTNDIYEEVF